MNTDKPADKVARRWWIRIGAKGSVSVYDNEPEMTPYGNEYYHVIEHDAYQAEVEKVRVLSEALEKISEMECPYGEGECDSYEKRNVAWEALEKVKEKS